MGTPFWEYEENGQFYAFDQSTNKHIEAAYNRNAYSQITLTIFSAVCLIDLHASTLTDHRTGNVQRIRRTTPVQHANIGQAMAAKRQYVWKYFDNGYRLFPPKENSRIERLFLRNSRAKFRLESSGQRYIIDFNNMTCINESSSLTHQLFRQDMSSISVGFDVPSALKTHQPATVVKRFNTSRSSRHPAELAILKHIGRLPTRPGFDSFSISTPSRSVFDAKRALGKLEDKDFPHGENCSVCWSSMCHRFPTSPPFKDDEDYTSLSVTSLPCGHVFHRACIVEALQTRASCPICKFGVEAIQGLQPDGSMLVSYSSSSVEGNKGVGTIHCTFNMDSGVQSSKHPNPGRHYYGDTRTHCMPANLQGFLALRWLAIAWCQFVLFTIGYSPTRNQDDVITYGTIHIKTQSYGGTTQHGWPDPDYFNRLHQECQEAGLKVGTFHQDLPNRAPDPHGADDHLFAGDEDDFDDDAQKYGL